MLLFSEVLPDPMEAASKRTWERQMFEARRLLRLASSQNDVSDLKFKDFKVRWF